MKRSLAITLTLVVSLALAACGGASGTTTSSSATTAGSSSGRAVTIRIGNIYNESTTYGKALDKFKTDLEAASNGTIKVQIFHGGQLGSEKDHIEAVKEGSLEMMETGTAGIGLYVPVTALFELWYSYDNIDILVKAFKSLMPELDTAYQEQGFKLLGAYYDGPRDILSKKKIETLADIKNVKFRVPGSDLYVQMAKALGAQAVSLPYTDVYTGLQTGTVEAMEGTPDSVLEQKFYEQAKYYIQDRHVFQPLSIVYNLDAWNKLTPDQQQMVQDAVNKSSEYHLSLVQKANDDALKQLQDDGIELVELKDRSAWKQAVEPASKAFAAKFGDLGQKILDAIASAGSSS